MGKLGIRKGTWESEKRSALPMIPQVASAEALGYRQHESCRAHSIPPPPSLVISRTTQILRANVAEACGTSS